MAIRKITYAEAIKEAMEQVMKRDRKVFIIGQGITSPWYVGNSCDGLFEKFGEKRVIDTPVSENGITGAAVGAAMADTRPVLIFPRMDFMYLAMDQIINQAANWHYIFGGKVNVPLVIRGIINRGGEQAAQHSQAIQAIFAHIPGLKVVMPSTPYDAKGLLISAIYDGNPVIYIDDRWLYGLEGNVPKKIYKVPIGKGIIKKRGKDITIVATSYMVLQSLEAAKRLKKDRIDAEVIDLRSIKPLDEKLILRSVKKTGRLLIVDAAWRNCGIAAEISARISEKMLKSLKLPIKRLTLLDVPAPASSVLEKVYYLNSDDIVKAVKKLIHPVK
jgi:pyruvate dehydrogenase E1 component beta subunit